MRIVHLEEDSEPKGGQSTTMASSSRARDKRKRNQGSQDHTMDDEEKTMIRGGRRTRQITSPAKSTSSSAAAEEAFASPTTPARSKTVDVSKHHGQIGAAVAEILIKWLSDRVHSLGQVSLSSPSSWLCSPLGKAARSNSLAHAQEECLDLLGRMTVVIGRTESVDVLVKHLEDKREMIAQSAARSLMRLNHKPELFTLHNLALVTRRLRDYRPEWRMFSLEFLSRMPTTVRNTIEIPSWVVYPILSTKCAIRHLDFLGVYL